MKYYARILRQYLLPHWPLILFALICSAIVAATHGATAWIVKPLMDKIFIEKNRKMLQLLPLILAGLYLVKGVFRFLQNYTMKYVSNVMIMNIRTDLYAKLQHMSYSFLKSKRVGELISRILNDVNVLKRTNVSLIRNFIRQIFTLIALFIVLFKRDWQLALISIVVFPFMGAAIYKIGKSMKKISKRQQKKMATISSLLIEGFSGAKVVKAFNAEEKEIGRFRRELKKLLKLNMKATFVKEINAPLMEFLGSIVAAFIVYLGGMRVISGAMTPGDFFSFMAALMLMYDPITKLSKVNADINAAIAASERIYAFLDLEPDVKDSPDAVELKEFRKEIVYDNVWFKYPDAAENEWVLKGISLRVRKGETVAIVGESGAGKTTLVDLLPRFFDVNKGAILIDGIDIRKIKIKSLRDLISVVSQDVILFNDTIYNNILYGKPTASYEEVIRAAKLAHAHEFIEKLPEGYETLVGDRGLRLSGGEKQRIAIARAILKNAPILILDEATSALDAESEKLVQDALYNLMEGKTVFIIAHRLATVIDADRIFVIDGGHIVEEGKHHELIKKNGKYKKLCELQFVSFGKSSTLVSS